jgi:hypothetical protein
MHTCRFYVLKADDCLTAVAETGDSAERLALRKIAQSFMLLADYVSAHEQGEISPNETLDELQR